MINKKSLIKNQNGTAMIESLPMILIFIVILSFAFGFYGIIHTATLNTIASRTYAFETFRNRTDLRYFRHDSSSTDFFFHDVGLRIHGVISENAPEKENKHFATERPLVKGMDLSDTGSEDGALHNEKVFTIFEGKRNQEFDTSPVWVMSQYGICLDSVCGN